MPFTLWLLIGAIVYVWMRLGYRHLFYKDSLAITFLKIPDVESFFRREQAQSGLTYQKFSAALNTAFMVCVVVLGPVSAGCAPAIMKYLNKLQ